MGKKIIAFSLAFFVALSFLFCQKQEIENKILKALEELKNGYSDEVVELLSEAIMMIQNEKEFGIKEIVLCSEIKDFRDYTKKPEHKIEAGDPFLLYIEPEGFRVVKEGDRYNIWVSEDVSLVDEKGEVVFEKKDWVSYKRGFDLPVIPFYITNRITDIPPGKYKFTLTLKDHYKKTFLTDIFEFVVE